MSTATDIAPATARSALVVLGLGTPLGTLTFLLQLTPLGLVANSPAFWALWAFAAGALVTGVARAVVVAVLAEVVGLVVWYGAVFAIGGFTWSAGGTRALAWGAAAVLAGTVFGAAGSWWRHRRGSAWAELGIALAAAVYAWSALYRFVVLGYPGWGTVDAVVAVGLVVLLGRDPRERLRAAAMAAPLVLLGVGGGVLLTNLVEVSGSM